MTGKGREMSEKAKEDRPQTGNAAVVTQLTRIADALERAWPPPPPPLPATLPADV